MEILKELRVSNDAMNDLEELRHRISEEGYVFFKKAARSRQTLGVAARNANDNAGGRLARRGGTDPMDGIADISTQCTEGDPEYTSVYHEVYKLEAFHRSGHWPEVVDMVGKIVGREVLPHPQKIARLWFPKYTTHTTPIHQDFVHFQGNFQTYTCWAPVGRLPDRVGRLGSSTGFA